MALIWADDRESKGANPYFDAILCENNKKHAFKTKQFGGGEISWKIQNVKIGDYHIFIPRDDNESPANSSILALVIERKTWKDLAASIKDRRMIEQGTKMKSIQEQTGCRLMYIIEGRMHCEKSTMIGRTPFSALHTKMRRGMLAGVPHIQSLNAKHTAEIIIDLARDILVMSGRGDLTPIAPTSQDEQIVKQLADGNKCGALHLIHSKIKELSELALLISSPSIDDEINEKHEPDETGETKDKEEAPAEGGEPAKKTAKEILTTTVAKADTDIMIKIWAALPKVSVSFAQTLAAAYSFKDIVIARGDARDILMQNIAATTYPSGIRFGEAKTRAMMHISYEGPSEKFNAIKQQASLDVVMAVPGVGKERAEAILATHDLFSICSGLVSEKEIADIKVNDRRVGNKLAEKIIRLLTE